MELSSEGTEARKDRVEELVLDEVTFVFMDEWLNIPLLCKVERGTQFVSHFEAPTLVYILSAGG